MTAIREQIFVEAEARLREVYGVIEVQRMPSGDPVNFPALHLFDGGQQIADTTFEATRFDLVLTIQGFVEGADGDAHSDLNALYASAVAALMVDGTLGGLAETIDEGAMQIEVARLASEDRLVFILDMNITFPTRRGSPAQPA